MENAMMAGICTLSLWGLSFLAVFVFRWGEGLWGNFIFCVNMWLAFFFFVLLMGPVNVLGGMISAMMGLSPVWGMITFSWATYLLILLILHMISGSLSHVRVKLPVALDVLGNISCLMSIWFVLQLSIVFVGATGFLLMGVSIGE